MNTKNKVPYFIEVTKGFKFIGFYETGIDAEIASGGLHAFSASDLYRLITEATEAVNNIDLNHPTLND